MTEQFGEVWHLDQNKVPYMMMRRLTASHAASLYQRGLYTHVASVPLRDEQAMRRDGGAAEYAYHLTNHIDTDWTQNPEIQAYVSPARSTSVGDLIIVDDVVNIVHPYGFKEIELGVFKAEVAWEQTLADLD